MKWIYNDDNCAVCIYNFVLNGIINETPTKVIGRGTTVLRMIENEWKVVHEHLSLERWTNSKSYKYLKNRQELMSLLKIFSSIDL
ncbi:MAG: nuclear transport factor 2 family protein [Candidatus Thermoplasmatota archaeon]|nr:nuclear transport factor 2 family protein [Candidatus Thermoplasmatota archaeon]